MSDIPEVWAKAMIRAGFTDPRYTEPVPSLRAMAEKAGLHTTTVSRMVRGAGVAKVENVAAVAGALGVDVTTVSGWVSQEREESEPYVFPAEVDLLTRREREALTELIRAITESRRQADAAANTRAEVSSVPVVDEDDVPVRKRDVRTARGRVVRRGDRAQGPSAPRG